MDLIDRNAVLNRYQEICNGIACMDCPFYKDGCALEKLILDVKPISRGKWIYKECCEGIGYFVCSECGHANWLKEDQYCSYCGTRMDFDEVNDEN